MVADVRQFYRQTFNGIQLVSKQKVAFRFPNEFLAEYYLRQAPKKKYVKWRDTVIIYINGI